MASRATIRSESIKDLGMTGNQVARFDDLVSKRRVEGNQQGANAKQSRRNRENSTFASQAPLANGNDFIAGSKNRVVHPGLRRAFVSALFLVLKRFH